MAEQDRWTNIQICTSQGIPFPEGRLVLAFILALSLFSLCFMLHPQSVSASAIVSGSCSSSHCYGSTAWPGHMYGADTGVGVVGTGGGDGFTLNGLWVIDTNPGNITDCRVDQNSRIGYCWIEVEYKAFGAGPLQGSEHWAWADVRPNHFYFEHDLATVASGDYGNIAFLGISQQVNPTTTWYVSIFANVTSYNNQFSTGNTMYADSIRIGMELSGTDGWSAPVAHFTYNQWVNSARNYNYQAVTGKKDPQTYPAYGNWAAYPNGNLNNGGDWYTCVQSAGC